MDKCFFCCFFFLESETVELSSDSDDCGEAAERTPPVRIMKRNSIASVCDEQNTSASKRKVPIKLCSMDELNMTDRVEAVKESFHRVDVSYCRFVIMLINYNYNSLF